PNGLTSDDTDLIIRDSVTGQSWSGPGRLACRPNNKLGTQTCGSSNLFRRLAFGTFHSGRLDRVLERCCRNCILSRLRSRVERKQIHISRTHYSSLSSKTTLYHLLRPQRHRQSTFSSLEQKPGR